jgi:hypothetical protein
MEEKNTQQSPEAEEKMSDEAYPLLGSGPPYMNIVLQERDDVLEEDDWGSYVITLDGSQTACRVNWIPPITNPDASGLHGSVPVVGWTLKEILEWLRLDDTGSHPCRGRVIRRTGEKKGWKGVWRMDELQKICRPHFARSPAFEDKLASLARWEGWSVTTPDGAVICNTDIKYVRNWRERIQENLMLELASELKHALETCPGGNGLEEAVEVLRDKLLKRRNAGIMEMMSRGHDRTWDDEHILVPGELAHFLVVRDAKKTVVETEISTNRPKLEYYANDLVLNDPSRTFEIFEAYLR